MGSSRMRHRDATEEPGLQVVTDPPRPVSTRDLQGSDQPFRRFFSALADENLAALLAPIWIV
jgi:hypothetical protein